MQIKRALIGLLQTLGGHVSLVPFGSYIYVYPGITEFLCLVLKALPADLLLTSSSDQLGLSQKTESQTNLKR